MPKYFSLPLCPKNHKAILKIDAQIFFVTENSLSLASYSTRDTVCNYKPRQQWSKVDLTIRGNVQATSMFWSKADTDCHRSKVNRCWSTKEGIKCRVTRGGQTASLGNTDKWHFGLVHSEVFTYPCPSMLSGPLNYFSIVCPIRCFSFLFPFLFRLDVWDQH